MNITTNTPYFHPGTSRHANAYRKRVSRMAGLFPGLSYLDVYLNDPRYFEGTSCPITLLELKNGQSPKRPPQNVSLGRLLYCLDNSGSNKLIILENPTPAAITEIGGRLKIEPQFWADFLIGPGWFGTGKLLIGSSKPQIVYRDDSIHEQLWSLPSDVGKQEYVCFRFVSHRDIKVNGSKDAEHSLLSTRYPIANNARPGPPHCAQSARMRGNLTIWTNQTHDKSPSSPWIGIVVIENGWGGSENERESPYIFRDIWPRPSYEEMIKTNDLYVTGLWEGRVQRALRSKSSMSTIYSNYLNINLKDANFVHALISNPSLLFADLYRLIACFWVTEIESQHLHLSWMEKYYHQEITKRQQKFRWFEGLFPNPFGSLPAKLEVDLLDLHQQRMIIGSYRHLISELQEHCEAEQKNAENSKEKESENSEEKESENSEEKRAENSKEKKPEKLPRATFKNLSDDLLCLDTSVGRLDQRIIRVADFLHSIGEDFETERSTYRNQTLLLLSLWAWLISPISVLTSIFGLGRNNDSNSPKVGDITSFWRSVIPFAVGVIVLISLLLIGIECINNNARKTNSLKKKQ